LDLTPEISMPVPLTLTDTQLVVLSAASQREDGLLVQPARLKGSAATAVADRLLAHGLVEEVAAGLDEPHWREEAGGTRVGLKITTAGLRAIGLTGEEGGDGAAPDKDEEAPAVRPGIDIAASPGPALPIREGSKQGLVLSLLGREQGATIGDLTAATGWLAHTTRAALTGLRQRGHDITRTKSESGASVYRLVVSSKPADAAHPETDEA
jgi:hypothetical protein